MLNNANSNNTCLETLTRQYLIDISQRRLRCISYIINLIIRAVIFSTNISKFEAELCKVSDKFSFKIWAKKGAVSRLYNLILYICQTD